MYYVGVDLAWGVKRPTGLAVIDDAGHLVELTAVRTDDEIVSTLSGYVSGECLVAFDAPLIVANATGNRPAEAALNRDFARFDAGAHPSNTGKSEFAGGPRGARLSARMGLDLDPHSTGKRRAIEVYPHPATVALFELGRTLKYKQKPGRTVDSMRHELLVLTTLLESLSTASCDLHLVDHDGWRDLRAHVENAGRKSELRHAEDQIDAVVCAYIARYATHRPADVTIYGDLSSGYILTPTLPEGHLPSPRVVAVTEDPAARAVREYAAVQPTLRKAAEEAADLVTTVLDDAGINYLSVTGRAKSVASFAAKVRRPDVVAAVANPATDLTDLIGVRVITYVHSDVAGVADLLADEFEVHDDRDLGLETAREGRFGYASRHLQAGLHLAQRDDYPALGGREFQIQIRTVLQHAWAEFEHDIRYKGTIPTEHAPDLDRRFTLAAGLLELADREFSTIRGRLQQSAAEEPVQETSSDPRISTQELAAFLAGQYADAGWSRTEHYAWISGLVLELGITSLNELADVVRPVDIASINERMGYRHPTGAVRRLDDALLAAFGDTYIHLRGNAHRVPLLRARLAKMREE